MEEYYIIKQKVFSNNKIYEHEFQIKYKSFNEAKNFCMKDAEKYVNILKRIYKINNKIEINEEENKILVFHNINTFDIKPKNINKIISIFEILKIIIV